MPNPVSALNKIKNMFSPLERTIIAHKMESMPSSQWAAYIKANAPKAAKKEALAIKLDELLARQPKISKQEIVKHIQEKSPKINVVEKGDMKLNAAESKELDELKQKASKYMFGDDAAITDDEFLRYNALASRYDNSTVSGLNQKSESYFNSARKAKEKGSWSDEFFDNRQGEFYKRRADALNAAPVDGNKTKYGRDDLVLPGGENYKEVILSLPQKPMSFEEWHNYNMPGARNPERYREDYERYLANPDVMSSKETFKSGHYDEPNILAHLRMNERPTAEGGRALFLEELQSDWAQQGRKEGFLRPDLHVERRAEIKAEMDALAKEATAMRERGESPVDIRQRMRQLDDALRDIPTPKGVPAGPYVGDTADWTGLGLKKAIERAVEQGHDSVAWTTGAQQADRYDLAKQVNRIEYHPESGDLLAYKEGEPRIVQNTKDQNQLSELIGKDAADKLINSKLNSSGFKTIEGDDLRVGGEGMKGYYDQIVPSTANDILKSMGVTERVKPIGVQLGGNNVSEQMGFEITPEIRDYVMNQGLPAFAGGGVVKAAAKGLREMAEQYITPKAAPAVNRIDMNYKDVTKRVPELTRAANMLETGEISASEYDKLVNSLKPVTPYSFVPAPATYEDAMRALTKNKQPMFGKASEIPAGEQTDLRLDIPAYKDHGVWVNSIHRKDAPTVYDSVSSVKNATMIGAPDKALKVAKGGPKAPFAVIRGEWNPISQEEAVKKAQENIASGEWVQVGYDPERHGYFYDRSTMEPIAGAEEIIQIGPLVIAKNPAYAAKAEQKFAGGGVVKATAKEMADLLKLYHGGRKFEQWNPKMIGMGEGAGRRNPLMAQGPGLYAGDTTDLAKIYLKYGGDDPALTELSVDPTNIINYYKKMSPEHLEKVKEAESRLDTLGLRTSNYGLQHAWLGGRAADPQRVRDILVNSGVDGLQQYLNPHFGTEFSIFNPDIIKRVRTMDSSEYAEGGAVHMDEGGLWEGYGAPIERATKKRQSAYYPQQEQAVRVTPTGGYREVDAGDVNDRKYTMSTDIDILNKYGFGVTKQGEIIKLPERSYTFDDGYTVTQPGQKIKRADITELRARYSTDDGVQYGIGRQPLAKGWSGYRADPRSQSSVGVSVSPYYKGINYTKNFAEGGAVETDDVDYDDLYEFKKDEPAFAEGGEVDYDAMYEFKDNTVGFAKGGPVLSVGRGEKLPVSKGAGLTAKGRAKYNAATGSNLKAPAPHPKTDADAGRRKSFCARMSGMPGPMKDEQGNPTRKAASLKRWNC